MILLVISGAMPRDPLAALGPAALIIAGGLLQMLFAIAAWPLQRYGPERQSLADLFRLPRPPAPTAVPTPTTGGVP